MLSKVLVISKYTFTDFLKSKIFYVTLAVGFITMLMTYVATEFTYGVPEKVALDVGLGMLSLSSLGIALFMGVTLLSKEIDSRTVYMVISRPVPRWVFITGKICGLICVLILNITLLSAMTLLCAKLLGGEINSLTYLAIGFNLLESVLLLLVVVFFSLFTNTTLSIVISLLLLISGHALKGAQGTMFVEGRPLLKTALEFYHLVLPAFYKLNLKDYVVYSQGLEIGYIGQYFLYGITYSLFLLILIIHIFNRKNLD